MKRKKLAIFGLTLVSLGAVFALIGCGGGNGKTSGKTKQEQRVTYYVVYPWGVTEKVVTESQTFDDTGLVFWNPVRNECLMRGPKEYIASSYGLIDTTYKEGYIFDGYYNSAENGTSAESGFGVDWSYGVVYARYVPDPNCVIKMYDANDDIASATPIATLGENLYDSALRNMPVPTDLPDENAAFDGWYADKELTKRVTDGDGVVVSERSILNDKHGWKKDKSVNAFVLYAKYSYPTYTVTFEFGDGHDRDAVTEKYDHNEKLALPEVTDGEYAVKEWTTDAAGYDVYDVTKPVTGDLTLYAVWRRHGYVGLWSGGEKVMEFDLYDGDSRGLDDFGLQNAGKTFDGWYTDPNFSPSSRVYMAYYNSGPLYAKWI